MEESVLSLFENAILKDVSESLKRWGEFPPFSILVESLPNNKGYHSKVMNYNPTLDIVQQCKAFRNHLIRSKQNKKLDLILTCCIANIRFFEEDEEHLEELDLSLINSESCLCIVSDSFALQSLITIPIVNNELDLSRRRHEALVTPFLLCETLSPLIHSN